MAALPASMLQAHVGLSELLELDQTAQAHGQGRVPGRGRVWAVVKSRRAFL